MFQTGRSLVKTVIAVKENIIFQPTYYNHTVLHSCKLCTKAELYGILRRKVLVKLVPLDFDCSYINIDILWWMARNTTTYTKSSALALFTLWLSRTAEYNSFSGQNYEFPEPSGGGRDRQINIKSLFPLFTCFLISFKLNRSRLLDYS